MGSWQDTDIDPNVLKRVTHLSNFENIPVKPHYFILLRITVLFIVGTSSNL